MKKFIEDNYLEDIRKKIPAYDLMLEIIFNAVLQVEMKTLKIKNVLSIGGQSFEVKKLSKICKNSEITLIEPSEIMINIVKNECNNLKNLEYICDKFENYTNNKNFQLCLCLLVLQFVDNSKKLLEKIYKSLDKNGVFIISVFSNKQLNYWKEFALARGARKEQVKKTFRNQSEVMNVLPADYVENLLKEIGFSKIEKVCEVLSVSMWAVRK